MLGKYYYKWAPSERHAMNIAYQISPIPHWRTVIERLGMVSCSVYLIWETSKSLHVLCCQFIYGSIDSLHSPPLKVPWEYNVISGALNICSYSHTQLGSATL